MHEKPNEIKCSSAIGRARATEENRNIYKTLQLFVSSFRIIFCYYHTMWGTSLPYVSTRTR